VSGVGPRQTVPPRVGRSNTDVCRALGVETDTPPQPAHQFKARSRVAETSPIRMAIPSRTGRRHTNQEAMGQTLSILSITKPADCTGTHDKNILLRGATRDAINSGSLNPVQTEKVVQLGIIKSPDAY
jgi:hypothetical protein